MNKDRDDDIALDAIRDYLRLNGYKTSLECLDKELKVIETNEKNNKNKVKKWFSYKGYGGEEFKAFENSAK